MATEIVRSLTEIDQKVKTLSSTLRQSTAETKELDKALKLDPKDAEAVAKKMSALSTAVGTATQKVALLKQKQDEAYKAFQRGDMTAAEFKKIELSVTKAENELKGLNAEIAKTQKMSVAQVGASFDNLTSKLNKVKGAADKVAKAAAAILASLAAAAVAFVNIGDELDDTSKKFSITAEELQKQRNIYAKTTDDAKNYDRALTSLGSVMSSIARGRGTAYLETLQKLGVSTTDASGNTKAAAVVYGELVAALSTVSDEAERASLASIIFGDNGLNVANVAALTKEEIAGLNEQLANSGIISSESAAQAGVIADRIDNVKQQLSAASGELMVALLPAILSIVEILQTTVIPIINSIAAWFASMSPQQQKLTLFLLVLVLLLPKVISIVMAVVGVIKAITLASYGAAGGVGAVSAASMPLQPILLAVAAAILVVVILFAMLAGKSKDVTSELNKQKASFSGMADEYSAMGADMGVTTENVSTSSKTSKSVVQYDINVDSHGDTPVSKDTADYISGSIADKINAELGGKI